MENVRRQVLEQTVDTMDRSGSASGLDCIAAAQERYPGAPTAVLTSAWALLSQRRTKQWWRRVEETIDESVIQRALPVPKGGR